MWTVLALAALAAGGCTHIKGVVVEDPSGRAMKTARFSVGRPDSIAVYATHDVDARGGFDFYIAPTDENNLYLYDAAGDPQYTLQRIDRSQQSEKMQLRMRPAPAAGRQGGPGVGGRGMGSGGGGDVTDDPRHMR
jgi:hypothetical protein